MPEIDPFNPYAGPGVTHDSTKISNEDPYGLHSTGVMNPSPALVPTSEPASPLIDSPESVAISQADDASSRVENLDAPVVTPTSAKGKKVKEVPEAVLPDSNKGE